MIVFCILVKHFKLGIKHSCVIFDLFLSQHLSQIPELSKSSVNIGDHKRVEQILTSMRNAGPSTLQVTISP